MHNSVAVLVLGMPRSGTSAVTKVLNLHGAALAENLLPASEANPKGFFESSDVLAIHERLLTAMGRSWFDISEMPEDWIELPAVKQAQEELHNLLRRDYVGKKIWIVKEPRMCRFVPLWLRVLEALGVSPRVLLVARHPEEVVKSVASMVGKDQWSAEHTKMLWLSYFFEAEQATRHVPRTLITYDQLLSDWAFHIERISSELNIRLPINSASAKLEVDGYLSSENRHHDYNATLNVSTADFSIAERTYALCNDMGDGYWDALSVICSEFLSALAFFQRPMRDLIHKVAKYHADIALLQQMELDKIRTGSEARILALQTEVNELRHFREDLCVSHQSELNVLEEHHQHLVRSLKSEWGEVVRQHQQEHLSLQTEIDTLKKISLSQQVNLSRLSDWLTQSEAKVLLGKNEKVELYKKLDELSFELSLVHAQEKNTNQILLEMQSAYSSLESNTKNKKWLMYAFIGAIKRGDYKIKS